MASASSMPPTDQNLKRLLECSLCLETFNEPRTLPCMHSFCKKCLENFVDGKDKDELNCPECRGHFSLNEGVAGMPRNHFICNMVEVLSIQQTKTIPCSHCEEASVGRCVTCELFMCAKCFKTHNDWPGFRDHLVLTMDELSKPENQSKITTISKCTKHLKKQLKYFCKTCDKLICKHCIDFDIDHKQHEFLPLEEAAQNKRMDLTKNCEILERAVANSRTKTHVLNEDIQSLSNNFTETKRLMNERKQQLLAEIQNTIDTKTNTMIGDVSKTFDVKKKNIDDEIHKNEAFFKRVNVSAEMARSLLENGDDEEIVRSYKSVQESVGRATETGCDQQSYHIDTSLSWSSNEIDKILRAEVKDIFKDKDTQQKKMMKSQTWNQSSQRSRLEFDPQTGKLLVVRNAPVSEALFVCGGGGYGKFTVYMNEEERYQIEEWVKRYPNIETGGDLFGAWIDDRTAVVQFVLGPGKGCRRTPVSFYQDKEYLIEAGNYLTQQHGLCNIGQWHSHHQLGLTKPSNEDETTAWENMPNLGLNRYIMFIATITDNRSYHQPSYRKQKKDCLTVKINPYLFEIKSGYRNQVLHKDGSIQVLKGNSPFRLDPDIKANVNAKAESMNPDYKGKQSKSKSCLLLR